MIAIYSLNEQVIKVKTHTQVFLTLTSLWLLPLVGFFGFFGGGWVVEGDRDGGCSFLFVFVFISV